MESYPSLRFASPHLSLSGTLLLFTEAKKESQSRLFFLEAIYGGRIKWELLDCQRLT
jgi:hypothetical protein